MAKILVREEKSIEADWLFYSCFTVIGSFTHTSTTLMSSLCTASFSIVDVTHCRLMFVYVFLEGLSLSTKFLFAAYLRCPSKNRAFFTTSKSLSICYKSLVP